MTKQIWYNGREFLFPKNNEYVAVCWRTKTERNVKVSRDVHTTTETQVRSGDPYIVFVMVEDEKYITHDTPVEGGMGHAFAVRIRNELNNAIEYIAENEFEKSKA